MAEINEAIH